jgi:hypothetical protein
MTYTVAFPSFTKGERIQRLAMIRIDHQQSLAFAYGIFLAIDHASKKALSLEWAA